MSEVEASTGSADAEPPRRRDYLQNQARFADFYRLQQAFVARLATQPALVRRWLESLPPREEGSREGPTASKSWRAARLSAGRRRELATLITHAESGPVEPLAAFLLKSLPVEIYFVIADLARPSLNALDVQAHALYRELVTLRDELFTANYGLAKKAVRGRKNYDELLSAASIGLLAAIDRYVPDTATSAKFGYFANFWIRYHISRYGQKNGTIVPLSINQQRIVRKIERYLAERRAADEPAPSEVELCTALQVSPEAYYWYLQRPTIVSLDSLVENEEGETNHNNLVASPAPKPDQELEDTEIAAHIRELLRQTADPQQRVMLAYTRRIGSLTDAAEDYLAELESQALQRLRLQAEAVKRSTST